MKRIFRKRHDHDLRLDYIYSNNPDMYWTMVVEIGGCFFSSRLQSGAESFVDFSKCESYEEIFPAHGDLEIYKMLYPKSLPWLEKTAEELYIEFCLMQGFKLNIKKV